MYDEWMEEGVHHFTEARNMKPPTRKMTVEWTLQPWSQLSKQLIINSFKSCALNLAHDWSEDASIHCFKEGEKMRSW